MMHVLVLLGHGWLPRLVDVEQMSVRQNRGARSVSLFTPTIQLYTYRKTSICLTLLPFAIRVL